MEAVFTSFVRALAGRPAALLVDAVWTALAAALRAEVRRRGLWEHSPHLLGLSGWEKWDDFEDGPSASPAGASGRWRGSALEELTADGYAYIFVDRLRSLMAQLAVKPQIDGLVLLNVRHFVFERQKRHDPIGFRVFEVAREAVEGAVAAEELLLLDAAGRIANGSLLAVGPGTTGAAGRAQTADLGTLVKVWNDDLAPHLFAPSPRQAELVARLRGRLPELGRAGVRFFRFKDLVDPLKVDARARWRALLEQEQGAMVVGLEGGRRRRVPIVWPRDDLEREDSFAGLQASVAKAIELLEADPRTRRHLTSLWTFLARVEADAGDASGTEGPLSHRRLAQQVGVPRERLPELLATLGRLIDLHRSPVPAVRPPAEVRYDNTRG